jgi:hypothetical protein
MEEVKVCYLVCNVTCNIGFCTVAERKIEELEKELLKVHQQMLDHLSDSQVICIAKLLHAAIE